MINNKINYSGKILNGDRLAIARAITYIENEEGGYIELLKSVHAHTGNAYRIGITGPPGAGKSTFTNQITKLFRKSGLKIGIIAIDPTSPYSGGAILGDRIRMSELISDKGVFIRSMATRGSLGGLARQATEVADVLDAAGFDIIIYETVGVGQVELDIAEAADTTIVMVVPEGGDIIQGMKSGLMEIGDIFALNKSDRPGSDRMQKDLEYVLHLKTPISGWYPRVLLTQAHKNIGIVETYDEIKVHKQFLIDHNLLEKRRDARLIRRVEQLIKYKMYNFFWTEERKNMLHKYLSNDKRSVSPYSLAEKMFENLKEL